MDVAKSRDPLLARRTVISHAAAAALGAALAPGTLRLLREDESPLAPPGFVPPGFRFLDSPALGIRVMIPADLAVVHPGDVPAEPESLAVFAELARGVGTQPGVRRDDQPDGVDILAVADDGTRIRVTRALPDEVPTPATLSSDVRVLGAADGRFCQTWTGLGPATSMRSTTSPAGGTHAVPGYVLWVRAGRGVVSIQVIAESDEVVDALYGIVLRTLQPIPQEP